jgi:hypothetical protein
MQVIPRHSPTFVHDSLEVVGKRGPYQSLVAKVASMFAEDPVP